MQIKIAVEQRHGKPAQVDASEAPRRLAERWGLA